VIANTLLGPPEVSRQKPIDYSVYWVEQGQVLDICWDLLGWVTSVSRHHQIQLYQVWLFYAVSIFGYFLTNLTVKFFCIRLKCQNKQNSNALSLEPCSIYAAMWPLSLAFWPQVIIIAFQVL